MQRTKKTEDQENTQYFKMGYRTKQRSKDTTWMAANTYWRNRQRPRLSGKCCELKLLWGSPLPQSVNKWLWMLDEHAAKWNSFPSLTGVQRMKPPWKSVWSFLRRENWRTLWPSCHSWAYIHRTLRLPLETLVHPCSLLLCSWKPETRNSRDVHQLMNT